jgi:hypothetical protein
MSMSADMNNVANRKHKVERWRDTEVEKEEDAPRML